MSDCKNYKTLGQGSLIKCGSKVWGPNSDTYYCETCLRKKIADAFIEGALACGASENTAGIMLADSEYSEFAPEGE